MSEEEDKIVTSQPIQKMISINLSSLNMLESGSDLDCPLELKNLTITDHLIIKSKIVDFLRETCYEFFNNMDQLLFFSNTKFRFNQILCCRNVPDNVLYISDKIGQEVIRVIRKDVCCSNCCCNPKKEACLLEVTVEAPIGEIIGKVKQKPTVEYGSYEIMSPEDELLLIITGPSSVCDGTCHCCRKDYFIFTPDMKISVGTIKKWSGFLKTGDFDLAFPIYLDVKTKATFIGAIFLIDSELNV